MNQVICMWSGPRNISTAMMYSFAERGDMLVFDEPLYGHYLAKTGIEHPGREEILETMEQDGDKVMQDMLEGEFVRRTLFLKQMTHHLVELNLDFLAHCQHFFLIRNPKDVLVSFGKVIAQPTLADIGIKQQFELYQHLQKLGINAPVVDSVDILKNPSKTLEALCLSLDIIPDMEMMSWEAGPRPFDGCWAKYWYANTHRSTGFAPYVEKEKVLASHLEGVLEEAMPFYQKLCDMRGAKCDEGTFDVRRFSSDERAF